MGTKRYDVVIVGGGSAGCALANRLSADPSTSVLVLEAGRSDFKIDPFIHMPAALPFPIGKDGKAIEVTVSVGVSSILKGPDTVQALMKRADLALYEAKSGGRNRVVAKAA